jgi:hypothetical protein
MKAMGVKRLTKRHKKFAGAGFDESINTALDVPGEVSGGAVRVERRLIDVALIEGKVLRILSGLMHHVLDASGLFAGLVGDVAAEALTVFLGAGLHGHVDEKYDHGSSYFLRIAENSSTKMV